MVKRVYGKANNFDVILERQDLTGEWRTTIPSNLDGEYYVELHAEDEAENASFLCKSLFIVSGHTLSIKILDNRYQSALMNCAGGVEEYKKEYQTEYREAGFTIERILCCKNKH